MVVRLTHRAKKKEEEKEEENISTRNDTPPPTNTSNNTWWSILCLKVSKAPTLLSYLVVAVKNKVVGFGQCFFQLWVISFV